jgi:hypothetical protein
MRTLIILIIFVSSIFSVKAQKGNVFSIKFNGKNIIQKKAIPESKAIEYTIAKTDLKLKNAMLITISEKEPNTEWHREFTVSDENGTELNKSIQKTTSGVFGISLVLPADFKGVIKVITMTLPNDPNVAATMRLRSYALANITIK